MNTNLPQEAEIPEEPLFSDRDRQLMEQIMLDDGMVTTREQLKMWIRVQRNVRFALEDAMLEDDTPPYTEITDPDDPNYVPF